MKYAVDICFHLGASGFQASCTPSTMLAYFIVCTCLAGGGINHRLREQTGDRDSELHP